MDSVFFRLGRHKLLITRPHTSGYGQISMDILQSLHIAKEENSRVYFLKTRKSVNNALYDAQCDVVTVLPQNSMVNWLMALLWAIGRLTRGIEQLPQISRRLVTGRAVKWKYEAPYRRPYFGSHFRRKIATDPIPVGLPAHREEQAAEVAERLGVPATARIITLHVREPGYLGDIPYNLRRRALARNARIETYFEAIDHLVSNGYTVVRIGDPTMTPVDRPGVVDLAIAPESNELVQVWSVMKSEFFLCCGSGPYFNAMLLNVPTLLVNGLDPIGCYPIHEHSLFVPKRWKLLDTGKVLSLAETLTPTRYLDGRHVTGANRVTGANGEAQTFEFIDNSSEEICQAVVEMRAWLERGPRVTEAQTEYKDRLSHMIRELQRVPKYGMRKFGQDEFSLGNGWILDSFAQRYLHNSGDEGPQVHLSAAQPSRGAQVV